MGRWRGANLGHGCPQMCVTEILQTDIYQPPFAMEASVETKWESALLLMVPWSLYAAPQPSQKPYPHYGCVTAVAVGQSGSNGQEPARRVADPREQPTRVPSSQEIGLTLWLCCWPGDLAACWPIDLLSYTYPGAIPTTLGQESAFSVWRHVVPHHALLFGQIWSRC
jgi:hypothetical protein